MITLREKINLLLLRLILLKTHYRQTLDFSFKNFDEAEAIASKFLNFLIDLDFVKNKEKNSLKTKQSITACRNKFEAGLDDDLNISSALAELFNFMNEINNLMSSLNAGQAKEIKQFIFEIDAVLGVIKPIYRQYQQNLNKLLKDKTVKSLLAKRAELRKNENYQEADKIRKELLQKGLVINDAKEGFSARLAQIL